MRSKRILRDSIFFLAIATFLLIVTKTFASGIEYADARSELVIPNGGGDPFLQQDEALIGFDVKYGLVIDSIKPIFAKLRRNGQIDGIHTGAKVGGGGGSSEVRLVIPGYVVTGLILNYETLPNGDPHIVKNIKVILHKWGGIGISNDLISSQIGISGGSMREDRITLNQNEIAIGIVGRSGNYIDRLTLIAAKPVYRP